MSKLTSPSPFTDPTMTKNPVTVTPGDPVSRLSSNPFDPLSSDDSTSLIPPSEKSKDISHVSRFSSSPPFLISTFPRLLLFASPPFPPVLHSSSPPLLLSSSPPLLTGGRGQARKILTKSEPAAGKKNGKGQPAAGADNFEKQEPAAGAEQK